MNNAPFLDDSWLFATQIMIFQRVAWNDQRVYHQQVILVTA